jgi:hypothetical protein
MGHLNFFRNTSGVSNIAYICTCCKIDYLMVSGFWYHLDTDVWKHFSVFLQFDIEVLGESCLQLFEIDQNL